MTEFQSKNPDFFKRAQEYYALQKAMKLMFAELTVVRPGHAEIELPFSDELTQHHGYIHAGVVTSIADTAGGFACISLIPKDTDVLAVEFKVNFLAPAKGEKLVAKADVIKLGKTLTICRVDVFSIENDKEILCAIMQQTLMMLKGKPGTA